MKTGIKILAVITLFVVGYTAGFFTRPMLTRWSCLTATLRASMNIQNIDEIVTEFPEFMPNMVGNC